MNAPTLHQQPPKYTDKFNLATPASRCPHCGHKIRAWENIPVISWLLLKAKCSNCSSPISIRYPLVELATGILSLAGIYGLWPNRQNAHRFSINMGRDCTNHD
jgi:leader peptidase (prepilin peptidase)/N-methyltransferase